MTKEQMQKEIARLNPKIEQELTEIKSLAQRILNGFSTVQTIPTTSPSTRRAGCLPKVKTHSRNSSPAATPSKKSSGRNKQ